ncbi:MAG: hypothetical protein WAU78_08260 [Roseiarcus sp.]
METIRRAASEGVQEEWRRPRAAISATAKPFTGRSVFPISPMYAYDLKSADAEAVDLSKPDFPLIHELTVL